MKLREKSVLRINFLNSLEREKSHCLIVLLGKRKDVNQNSKFSILRRGTFVRSNKQFSDFVNFNPAVILGRGLQHPANSLRPGAEEH